LINHKAISLDPKSAFAYHLRGLTHFGAGEHLKAIAEYIAILFLVIIFVRFLSYYLLNLIA
jgi:hypothetical protein